MEYPSDLIGLAEIGKVPIHKEDSIERIFEADLGREHLPQHHEGSIVWLCHALEAMHREGWLTYYGSCGSENLINEVMAKSEEWVAARQSASYFGYERGRDPAPT